MTTNCITATKVFPFMVIDSLVPLRVILARLSLIFDGSLSVFDKYSQQFIPGPHNERLLRDRIDLDE